MNMYLSGCVNPTIYAPPDQWRSPTIYACACWPARRSNFTAI